MSMADEIFINMCRDILENGTSTEGEKVRPHWPDGTTAYTIKKISGNTEVRSHLKSMGFNEGTEVKLITQLDGDVIIHVKESRVAINKDQARHILV